MPYLFGVGRAGDCVAAGANTDFHAFATDADDFDFTGAIVGTVGCGASAWHINGPALPQAPYSGDSLKARKWATLVIGDATLHRLDVTAAHRTTGNACLSGNAHKQNNEEHGNKDSGHFFLLWEKKQTYLIDANTAIDSDYFIDIIHKVNRSGIIFSAFLC